MERFKIDWVFLLALLVRSFGIVCSYDGLTLTETDSQKFKEIILSSNIVKEDSVELQLQHQEFLFALKDKGYSMELKVFKDDRKLFNARKKNFHFHQIFNLKTCSNYDATLELLHDNTPMKFFGGSGPARLNRKLTIGPRIGNIALDQTSAKPRELNFEVIGVDLNCENVEFTIFWKENNQPKKEKRILKNQPLKVDHLIPKTSYDLRLRINYTDYDFSSDTEWITAKTTELELELEMKADVGSIYVSILTQNVDLTGLTFTLCSCNKKLRPLITICDDHKGEERQPFIISDLDMLTEYKVCAISNYTEQSEVCKSTWTLEGMPYPPRDLRVTDKASQIVVEWNESARYSGNVNYSVVIESKCLLPDTKHCDNEAKKCTKSTSENKILQEKKIEIQRNPNWAYIIKVEAINRNGRSGFTKTEMETKPECFIPKFNYIIRSREILARINPFCQLQGPQEYYLNLASVEKKATKEKYKFTNLNPSQQYKITISSNLTNCTSEGEILKTLQESPEGVPLFEVINTTEDSLTVKIRKPEKTYEKENETLTYRIEIEHSPLENDEDCSKKYETSNVEVKTNEMNIDVPIRNLMPNQKHVIKVLVANEMGPGMWSKKKVGNTSIASQKKFSDLSLDLLLTPTSSSINVKPVAICPYPGDYHWNLCLYRKTSLIGEASTQHYLDGTTNHTFRDLEADQAYSVCSFVEKGREKSVSICSESQQTSTQICKEVITECKELREPTKSLTVVDWNSNKGQFDPFRSSQVQFEKDTFNWTYSGDLIYYLSYQNITHIQKLNILNESHIFIIADKLLPNTSTELSLSAKGCGSQSQSLNVMTSTQPIYPAKPTLFCDNQVQGKVMLLIEDSFQNILYGRTKLYKIVDEEFQIQKLVNVDHFSRSLHPNSECHHLTHDKISSPDGIPCCIWINTFYEEKQFTHTFEYDGKEFSWTTQLDGCLNYEYATIVSSTVTLLILIIIFTGTGLWVKSKFRKQPFHQNNEESMKLHVMRLDSNVEEAKLEKKLCGPISLNEFCDCVKNNPNTFQTVARKLFKIINSKEDENDFSYNFKAGKFWNDHFGNGNQNFLPFDENRVSLRHFPINYVNASWIRLEKSSHNLIAAQTPIKTTVDSFWAMIIENKISLIIMMTTLKVDRDDPYSPVSYWPDHFDKAIYGNYKVRKESMRTVAPDNDVIERIFKVSAVGGVGEPTDLTQLQFKVNLENNQDAIKTRKLLDFLLLTRHYFKKLNNSRSPILVHCTTGVDQSGVLIALNHIANQLDSKICQLDICAQMQMFRNERYRMIRNSDHFLLLLQTIALYIEEEGHRDTKTSQPYENYYDAHD